MIEINKFYIDLAGEQTRDLRASGTMETDVQASQPRGREDYHEYFYYYS